MVREENVKLMTKIAIYERREGKEEIPINSYYKGDYVRINTLKSIVSATIAFCIAVALIVVYKMDYILANVLRIDYKGLGIIILSLYGIWVLLYWLVARILYASKYEKTRSSIIIYNHNLKKLQEESRKEIVKAKKGVVISDDFIEF